MSKLLTLPLSRVTDANVNPLSGALLYAYLTGTTTPTPTYTTSALSVAHPNPIVADGNGLLPPVFLDPSVTYRFKAKTAAGADIAGMDWDPVTALSSGEVQFLQSGTGAIIRTSQDKMRDFIPVALLAGIDAGTSTTDVTAYFQAAVDAAHSAGKAAVYAPPGYYIVHGTITMPAGVTLYGESSASEYYHNSPSPLTAKPGTLLYKPSAGTAGPIIQLVTGAAIRGLYLKHLKEGGATTGIVRMGGTATSDVCYYAGIKDCRIYGHAINNAGAYAAANCHGIYFPDSDVATSKQRYFNKIFDNTITNCDRCIHLGAQSNANQLVGNLTRQSYRHYYLDGGASECVDNVISGAQLANIDVLPTVVPVCFTLANSCLHNAFIGYTTECLGKAFDISASSTLNQFVGVTNELTATYVPLGNIHGEFAAPINRDQISQILLVDPARAGDRFIFGRGNKCSLFQSVTGTLPQTNGGAYPQALVAADADSKIIVTFDDTVFKKSLHPTFFCKFKVFCSAPANGGTSVAEVEFLYRPTNTSVAAGVLSVLRCSVKGAAIGGLHFIHGGTGATAFKIGLVGGGSAATVMNFVAVSMEIEGLTYDANAVAFSDLAGFSFVSAAATANDVTDAITLLTVADTVV
jgi:hypothetical protein